jgi:undecaprenyl-diphosphatase
MSANHPGPTPRWSAANLDLAFLGGWLAVVLASLVFLAIADTISEGDGWHADQAILRALRRADDSSRVIGPRWLGPAFRDLTSLGGAPVLTLVTFIVLGDLLIVGRARAAAFTAASIGLGALLNPLLKLGFDRPRPEVVPHLVEATSSSFPSGHSMGSAIVYLTLGALLASQSESPARGLYALTVAALLSALVGVSRVVLGVHYPTDVLGGWAAGLVWAIASYKLSRRLQKQGRLEPPMPVAMRHRP